MNLFEYISREVLFIIDTPEAIDFSNDYLKTVHNYRHIKINPLGSTNIEVKCTPPPKMNSSIQHFASELMKWFSWKAKVYVAADGDIHLSRLKDLLMSLDTAANSTIHNTDSSIIDNEVNFDALSLIEQVH